MGHFIPLQRPTRSPRESTEHQYIAGVVTCFTVGALARADETVKFRIIMHVTAAQTLTFKRHR